MQRERIGALPVLRDGHLVGIVTRSDLLRALIALAEQVGG
jgi:CBS domain-containing protein